MCLVNVLSLREWVSYFAASLASAHILDEAEVNYTPEEVLHFA